MKNKSIAFVSCLLALSVLFSFSLYAYNESDGSDGVIGYYLRKTGSGNVNEWIKGAISDEAGKGAEWYIFALSQNGGDFDFTPYSSSLYKYLSENEASGISYIRCALGFISSGVYNGFVSDVLSKADFRDGIMNVIFGLHILNNGYTGASCDAGSLSDTLLSLRNGDGGWSLYGTSSDTDVTAMAICALSPYKDDEKVYIAIDGALSFLSSRQLESGGFSSFGTENAESAAQVIIALSSLGIDSASDGRFIKNGSSVLDALSKYRCEDGGFCHIQGDKTSDSASFQALCAFTSYERLLSGKGSLFIFDRRPEKTDEEALSPGFLHITEKETGNIEIKYIIAVSAVLLSLIICLILFLRGKRKASDYIIIISAALIIAAISLFANIQTGREHENTPTTTGKPTGYITLSVKCSAVMDKGGFIPSDGVIIPEEKVPIYEGDSVFSVLKRETLKRKTALDFSGSYIKGINYLYEKEYGPLSGWMYKVNGESPSVGCGSYFCMDGDNVLFYYTLDMN